MYGGCLLCPLYPLLISIQWKFSTPNQLPSPSKFCSLRFFFFSTTEVINAVFQSNQRFQTIEFADRPVPERLDIFRSFLFYEQKVLQVECVIVKYNAWHIRNVRRVVEVSFSSSWRLNHWYLKYLYSATRLHILTTAKIYQLNTYNTVNLQYRIYLTAKIQ